MPPAFLGAGLSLFLQHPLQVPHTISEFVYQLAGYIAWSIGWYITEMLRSIGLEVHVDCALFLDALESPA
jgi:hypothetical protein